MPSKVAGPYLLYCALAVWHFKHSWWAVLIFGSMGIVASYVAIFELRRARTLKQERDRKTRILNEAPIWPIAEAFVYDVCRNLDARGVRRVTLRYIYKAHGEEFVGTESFELTSRDDAERFESRFTGNSMFTTSRIGQTFAC